MVLSILLGSIYLVERSTKEEFAISKNNPVEVLEEVDVWIEEESGFDEYEERINQVDPISSLSDVLLDVEREPLKIRNTIAEKVNDNVFTIKIGYPIVSNHSYTLTYDVKGVRTGSSISKSINEFPNYDGYEINVGEDWVQIRENLNPLQLKKGINSIRFTSLKEDIAFEVRDVRIKTTRELNRGKNVVFKEDTVRYIKEGKVYVSGFVLDENISRLVFNKTDVYVNKGGFESFIPIEAKDKELGKLKYNYYLGGKIYSEEILLSEDLKESDYISEIPEPTLSDVVPVLSTELVDYYTDKIEILIPTSVELEEKIRVHKTRKVDSPPFSNGIINVTPEKEIYRCLPHGMTFSEAITLKIPYDEKLIPSEYTLQDMQTLYYDEYKGKWLSVQIDSIDIENSYVYAKTDHFTDYINGIVQVPESPMTSEFTPTMMQDIKAANPVAGLNIMSPPSVSQKGEASAAFPIVVPPGRGGMQPQLAWQYSSEGSSSCFGYGWSISVPAISVDTRWGVPQFDASIESEIYLLNGQQLMYPNEYMPNRHGLDEGNYITGEQHDQLRTDYLVNNTKIFHERKLGSFAKIERIGSGPTDYIWQVTGTNGTVHEYGAYANDNEKLDNGSDEISYWPLLRSTDIHGNAIHYEYIRSNDNLYIDRVTYMDGTFEVDFNYSAEGRQDVVTNGRYGFFQKDDQLLEWIEVRGSVPGFTGDYIRKYIPKYQGEGQLGEDLADDGCIDNEGRFHKTLLTTILEEYPGGTHTGELKHDFYYYDDTESGLFGSAVYVEIPCDTVPPCNGSTIDTDMDGIMDPCDNCPTIWNPDQHNDCVPINPCGITNSDGDEHKDACDNCPEVDNADQSDIDNDGIGDACDLCDEVASSNIDQDGDGLGDECDLCPTVSNAGSQLDGDMDGIGDQCDICPEDSDPYQEDTDGDGVGDACDNCPEYYNTDQTNDIDEDGVGYFCDNCPYVYNPYQYDSEGNPYQEDSDGDGIGDACEAIEISCGTILAESGVSTNDTIYFTIPENVNQIFVLFNPLQEPQLLNVKRNGVLVASTGPIKTSGGATCSNALIIDSYDEGDVVPLQYSENPAIRLDYDYNTMSTNPDSEISIELPIDVMPGETIALEITAPSCNYVSSWFAAVECESQIENGAGLANNSDNTKRVKWASEQEDVHQLVSEHSVYTITFAEASYVNYSYVDIKGNRVERSISDLQIGRSRKFVALRNSVVVDTDTKKYSTNHVRPYYTREELRAYSEQRKMAESEKAIVNNKAFSSNTKKGKKKGQNESLHRSSPEPDCGILLQETGSVSTILPDIADAGSPLGTSKTVGSNYGGSIGIGFSIGLPNTDKKGSLVTGQGALNGSVSESYSQITTTDLNGDGLTDILYRKENDQFAYRPHKIIRTIDDLGNESLMHDYGDYVYLPSIAGKEIQRSNSSSTNINFTGTVSAGPFGIHFLKTNSKSSSESTVYMTDANGDGLPDIAVEDKVLFNYLNEDGVPTFTPSSEPTENMLVEGESVEVEEIIPAIPEEYKVEIPSYDVVKVWKAPADGKVILSVLGVPSPLTAKVSIETDINGIYSHDTEYDRDGTCRLYHGPLSGLVNEISEMPVGAELYDCKCDPNYVDPCENDEDEDGISDCLDPCPLQVICDCEESKVITEDVIDNISETESADIDITVQNEIHPDAEGVYHAGQWVQLGGEDQPGAGYKFGTLADGNGNSGELLAFIKPCDDTEEGGEELPPYIPDDLSSIRVKKGQNIYFRLHAESPFDEVSWNPQVRYTSVQGQPIDADAIVNSDGVVQFKSAYSNGFGLSSRQYTTIPSKWQGSVIDIDWDSFNVGGMSDDVTFRIEKLIVSKEEDIVEIEDESGNAEEHSILADDISRQVIREWVIPAGGSATISPGDIGTMPSVTYVEGDYTDADPEDHVHPIFTALKFSIISESNINWEVINWQPKVTYRNNEEPIDYEPTVDPNDPADYGTLSAYQTEEVVFPVVEKTLYKNYSSKFYPGNAPTHTSYSMVEIAPISIVPTQYILLNEDIMDHLGDIFEEEADDLDCDAGYTGNGSFPLCTGEIRLVVKQSGKAIGFQRYLFDKDGIIDDNEEEHEPIAVTIRNAEEGKLSIELYADNGYLSDKIFYLIDKIPVLSQFLNLVHVSTSPKRFDKNKGFVRNLKAKECNLYHESKDPFGHFYRDWGQFFYKNDLADAEFWDDFGGLLKTSSMPDYEDYISNTEGLGNEILSQLNSANELIPDLEEEFGDPLEEDASTINTDLENLLMDIDIPESPLFVTPFPYNHPIEVDPDGDGISETGIRPKWRGLTVRNFSSKYEARAIDMEVAEYETFTEVPAVVTEEFTDNTGAYSIPRLSVSKGSTYSYPSILPNVSGHRSDSESLNLTDYIDINGDRYPDILTNSDYLRTRSVGGHVNVDASEFTSFGDLAINKSRNEGVGASGEAGLRVVPTESSEATGSNRVKLSLGYPQDAAVGFSLRGNIGVGVSQSNSLWADINGDGLADQINGQIGPGLQTILSTGNGLQGGMPMEYTRTYPSFTSLFDVPSFGVDVSASLGVGFVVGHGESIQGGFSVGKGINNNFTSLIDINGDGQKDIVQSLPFYSQDPLSFNFDLKVSYNDGSGFEYDNENVSRINAFDLFKSSQSTHYTNNLALTVGVAISVPIPFVPLFFKIAQGSIHGSIKNTSYNTTRKTIEDFDGDGYPDFIEHVGDYGIQVRYNNTKRTNKLKKIVTPLEGEYTVDYDVVRPTYDCQSPKWVMSKLKVEDTSLAFTQEGAKEFTKYYRYHNPRHDRREREFLGFEVVRTIDHEEDDTYVSTHQSTFDDGIYRQNVQIYHNENYYVAGKPKESYLVEGGIDISTDATTGRDVLDLANATVYTKTSNTYQLRDADTSGDVWTMTDVVLDTEEYDRGGTKGLGRAFCVLKTSRSEQYEGSSTTPLSLIQNFTYDDYSRVEEMNHNGEYTTEITYFPLGEQYTNHNLVSIPQKITVTTDDVLVADGNDLIVIPGSLVREREVGSINTKGQPEQVIVTLNGSSEAITDLTYNGFGLVESVLAPEGNNNNRLLTEIEYEGTLNMYPDKVTSTLSSSGDVFVSESVYDYIYGQVESTTDIHGNEMEYAYDELGRNTKITAPFESDYTIDFEYAPFGDGTADRPYSTTKHFDIFNSDNDIETITIANSLGQSVQVKKDITLNGTEHMSISGITTKDKYGRAIASYQPLSEGKDINTGFVGGGFIYPSLTEYDVLDRPVLVTDAAGNTTSMSYTIDLSAGGIYSKTAIVVDQNGTETIESDEYKDANGRTEVKVAHGPDGAITTTFAYDGIGQLKSYTPQDGLKTSFVYDLGGRMTSRTHPDAGITTFGYDAVRKYDTSEYLPH